MEAAGSPLKDARVEGTAANEDAEREDGGLRVGEKTGVTAVLRRG